MPREHCCAQEALPALLDGLEERLDETRSGPPLEVDVVLGALDSLGRALDGGGLDPSAGPIRAPRRTGRSCAEVRGMLRREALEARLQLELGELRPGVWVERPFGRTLVQPLGVLFHVTPGNQPGIPLFSALEGLLTGNVNLIKLPHGDRGLSLAALKLLTEREPRLAPWLYAFEVSSRTRRPWSGWPPWRTARWSGAETGRCPPCEGWPRRGAG